MELYVIIGLVTLWLTIVVVGLAVAGRTRKLEEKIDRTSGELRDELRSEIQGVRGEIGTLRASVNEEIGSVREEIGSLRASVNEEIGSLRASVREEIASVREELGGRIDAVVAELTRTRMAVARLEGSVLGIAPPDTGTDTA
ncbi:MAG: hypothetical protein OXN85_11065 [Gemmatimonadetes bacterium]|nr:hypothetical protein [Candidatus Palauibacter australiensis]